MVTEPTIVREYVHNKPGTQIPFGIAGFYTPIEENVLDYKGRQVLYITGKVDMEAPCCNMNPDWIYAMVPGYVKNWHYRQNDAEENVSEVEPVKDKAERKEIRDMITAKEGGVPVDFW